ncbi:hypothetical protein GCM10010256_73870 [Streptomyces coeruleorubidus]|uniref:Uncharacterized protein n=1 Tax=Streptomyces coeruleorubidus TaxID=116188 RepID=A0A5J6HSW0_STRC4|nr:hypothetical protein CP976_00260 [Streptomyces coeruleorubidus]GGU03014.1 hypothetical protein GCM10010256_73870 [Streptomyces coeruleorubidus]
MGDDDSRAAVSEPDPSALTCPGAQVGRAPHASARPTSEYGLGGCPLCQWCMAPAMEKWGPGVRYINTRS